MVFHYVNAWEEKAENGDEIIRAYGCVVDGSEFNLDFREEHTFLKGQHTPTLNKFIFNLKTGEVSMTPVFKEYHSEFPALDWDLIG
jgi:carotenoid cleavage dioxygenase-like enzyme